MGRSRVQVTLRKSASASPDLVGSKRSQPNLVAKGTGSKSSETASPVQGVNLSKLLTIITELSNFSSSRVDSLSPEVSRKLEDASKLIQLIIGSPKYEEITNHINKVFNGKVPIPGTVCAFFIGCMSEYTKPFNGQLGCAAPCAGNASPHGEFKQCSDHVFLLSDSGLDMRTSIAHGVSDKAYIYCESEYESLSDLHISTLQSLGINYVTIAVYDGNLKYQTIMTNYPLKSMLNYGSSVSKSVSKSASLQNQKSVSYAPGTKSDDASSPSRSKSILKNKKSQSGPVSASRSVKQNENGEYYYEEYIDVPSESEKEEYHRPQKGRKQRSYSWLFIAIAILLIVIIICAAIWFMRRVVSSTSQESTEPVSTLKITETESQELAMSSHTGKHYGPGISM